MDMQLTPAMQIQALVTFLFPFVLQFAKRSQHPLLFWLDQNRPQYAVLLSLLTALFTNMGIHFAHTASSATVVWGPPQDRVHGALNFLALTVVQFVGQHAVYEGLARHVVPAAPNVPPTVSTIAQRANRDPATIPLDST